MVLVVAACRSGAGGEGEKPVGPEELTSATADRKAAGRGSSVILTTQAREGVGAQPRGAGEKVAPRLARQRSCRVFMAQVPVVFPSNNPSVEVCGQRKAAVSGLSASHSMFCHLISVRPPHSGQGTSKMR